MPIGVQGIAARGNPQVREWPTLLGCASSIVAMATQPDATMKGHLHTSRAGIDPNT